MVSKFKPLKKALHEAPFFILLSFYLNQNAYIEWRNQGEYSSGHPH